MSTLATTSRVLVLDPGSGDLKATVLEPPRQEILFGTMLDRATRGGADERDTAVGALIGDMERAGIAADSIGAVGYRVVHGGDRFTGPTLVDSAVIEAIDGLRDLAPVHNPLAAATIRAGVARLPSRPHVAVFDTAFHASLPEAVRRYPVPDAWAERFGVRRYGFHGLSVAWSVRRAAELLGRPVSELGILVAHLGSGCSVTAVQAGRSVDTSMGLTPLEGLMMGSRSGSIDPGIVFHLVRRGVQLSTIEADLLRASGLVGVGGTSDMRRLIADEGHDPRAALAIDMFVRRTAAGIASAATALRSIDAIVFTGGVGEHAATVRHRVCAHLRVLHVPTMGGNDAEGGDRRIAGGPDSPAVLVVHAREDVVIAEAVAHLAGIALH